MPVSRTAQLDLGREPGVTDRLEGLCVKGACQLHIDLHPSEMRLERIIWKTRRKPRRISLGEQGLRYEGQDNPQIASRMVLKVPAEKIKKIGGGFSRVITDVYFVVLFNIAFSLTSQQPGFSQERLQLRRGNRLERRNGTQKTLAS